MRVTTGATAPAIPAFSVSAFGVRVHAAGLDFGGAALFEALDLDLAAGSWTCLLGPSGVGKTSLLRLIAGLERIGFGAVDCQGTYFISADFRPLLTRGPLRGFNGDDVELCKKLTVEAGVTAIPVSAFYQNDAPRHFIRFSFCKKDETLDSAIERMEKYFSP